MDEKVQAGIYAGTKAANMDAGILHRDTTIRKS